MAETAETAVVEFLGKATVVQVEDSFSFETLTGTAVAESVAESFCGIEASVEILTVEHFVFVDLFCLSV